MVKVEYNQEYPIPMKAGCSEGKDDQTSKVTSPGLNFLCQIQMFKFINITHFHIQSKQGFECQCINVTYCCKKKK